LQLLLLQYVVRFAVATSFADDDKAIHHLIILFIHETIQRREIPGRNVSQAKKLHRAGPLDVVALIMMSAWLIMQNVFLQFIHVS
jgi:hypothetical protein